MSTNGQLVFTDVDKITFKGVGNTSNAVVDTVTGKIGVGIDNPDANLHVLGNSYVSTNLELGGTLIMGTVNVSAHHSLEAVTAEGNTTPLTVEFQNTDTSLVASGNVVATGNVTADYFVGNGSNITGISQTLQAITDHGNVTSNTIQFSNALTSFVTSSSIDIGGSVQIKNQNQNTLNADISVISPDTTKGAWYGASSWEVSKLTASDAAANDEFGGRSIDISGDTLVVGAYNEGGSAGAVYVFTRNTTGSGWVERVKLTTSNNSGNGKFGERVRIQDDTIVVSAPSDDSNKGAVYIFTRNTPGDLTSGWTEQYKITGSQSTAGDYFSKGLDLYGDTLIVGSYHADNGSGAYGGEAYVFTRTAGNINSSWTERARLVPTTDHAAGDRFGNHISLYEDTVAIGAYGDGGNATGSFYIFTRTTPGDLTSGWTERQKIAAHDAASYDYYGWAISLYENTLMVGAMEENNDKGKVYVYSRTGGITSSWSHVTDLTASDAFTDDRFGYDLHLEKDVAVISSPRDYHPNGGYPYGAGAIYIFERNTPGLSTSSWTQIRKIVPANGGALDYFGDAVAMDGGTIVVSAPGDDIATDTAGAGQHTDEGSAYVYTANVSGLKLNADHVSITGTHGLAVSGDVGVNGDIRLGASVNNTADDNTDRTISTAGQLFIKANDSDLDGSYTNMILQAGNINPGKIVIGGNDGAAYGTPSSQIEFYTPGATAAVCKIEPGGFLLPKAFAFFADGTGGSFTNNAAIMKDVSTLTVHFDSHPNPNGIYRGLREQSNDGNRGIYFAPVKGIYHFTCKARIPDNLANQYEIEWYIKRNGNHSPPYAEEKYTSFEMWASPADGGGRRAHMSSTMVHLDVDEGIFPRNDGGTVTCSRVTFGGYFLGTYD